jgi:HPt (histidine-containing phosphotransfer) domain-containing protein
MADGARLVIRVDEDLKDFVPEFLARRHQDVAALRDALQRGDYEAVRVLGHNMKGSGGGYGFHGITSIGDALEQAAKRADAAAIEHAARELAAYLESVEVA